LQRKLFSRLFHNVSPSTHDLEASPALLARYAGQVDFGIGTQQVTSLVERDCRRRCGEE
jgi:hypothetical protein